MASIDIKAVYADMVKCSQILDDIGNDVSVAYTDMDDFLNKKMVFNGKQIYANWQSDARSVFEEKAVLIIDLFTKVQDECIEASNTLKHVIKEYEQRDSDLAAMNLGKNLAVKTLDFQHFGNMDSADWSNGVQRPDYSGLTKVEGYTPSPKPADAPEIPDDTPARKPNENTWKPSSNATTGSDSKTGTTGSGSESKTDTTGSDSKTATTGSGSESKTDTSSSDNKTSAAGSESKTDTTGSDNKTSATGSDSKTNTTGSTAKTDATGSDNKTSVTGSDNKTDTTNSAVKSTTTDGSTTTNSSVTKKSTTDNTIQTAATGTAGTNIGSAADTSSAEQNNSTLKKSSN